jgi:tRNA A-37 threonylcarbamoyl transferase component Bud32
MLFYIMMHTFETWGGFIISPLNSKANTQTGRLTSRTLLHKRYVIMRTIGHGGMAAVYQAKDLKHDTTCAIKEMSLSSIPPYEHAQAIQNFLAEATILSRLNHPNLPAFTDFFTEDSRHFLVMEYIEGDTLEALLEHNDGSFSERRVLGWARQLCDVLEYLHSQQPPVIFRDMKPGNIMLRRDGRIKLIDFGIARIFRHSGSRDTQMLGTPGFAPPEQYGSSQTDERSDIYSLAMTLFQLMTNVVVEDGFGLQDIHAAYPFISPAVAFALEKATAPESEDRYQSVAVFRRALLGVGTFAFEQGNPATTPEELAELCAHYPEEAADYLFAGEIEFWLHEIGAPELARATKRIRITTGNPAVGVERFLQVVIGSNSQVYSTGQGRRSTAPGMRSTGASANRVGGLRPVQQPTIVVRPEIIDFGQIYPGISAPMLLYITGNHGTSVRGTIEPVEPWIIVNTTTFDGMSSLVRVRVDSTNLQVIGGSSEAVSTHYEGSILVRPAGEASVYTVTVALDVLSYNAMSSNGPNNPSRQTASQDLSPRFMVGRSLDEGDIAVDGAIMTAPLTNAQVGQSYYDTRHSEYRVKYGKPGSGSVSSSWNPLHASPQQYPWLKRGLTFTAAFMTASISYLLLAHLPPLANTPLSLFSSNQWSIVVFLGMVPLATLGALLADWDSASSTRDRINRFCTGLSVTLSTLGFGTLAWQVLLHRNIPSLQLCAMLLLTAAGAAIGTHPLVSEWIIDRGIWAMKLVRPLVIIMAVLLGGTMGLLLTSGAALGCFTPFGVLLGMGIAVALVSRVERLIKHP